MFITASCDHKMGKSNYWQFVGRYFFESSRSQDNRELKFSSTSTPLIEFIYYK